MLGYIWSVFTYRLARKHALVSWWVWVGIALFGASSSAASYLHTAHPGYWTCFSGFVCSFLSYLVLGTLYDKAARKIEWATWEAKERVAFAEKQCKEMTERARESVLQAREPITALLARIQGIIQKHGNDGEEWKNGGRS